MLWLVGRMAAKATLLHVSPDLERAAASAEVLMAAAGQRRAEDAGWRRRLTEPAAYAPEKAAVTCEVIWGSPAATLLEQARARDADLLLVGASGAGGLRGAFSKRSGTSVSSITSVMRAANLFVAAAEAGSRRLPDRTSAFACGSRWMVAAV